MRILGFLGLLGVSGLCFGVGFHQIGGHHWHAVLLWVAESALFLLVAVRVKRGRS
jgi:hypothetical protein